jgi:hypothetical protein
MRGSHNVQHQGGGQRRQLQLLLRQRCAQVTSAVVGTLAKLELEAAVGGPDALRSIMGRARL